MPHSPEISMAAYEKTRQNNDNQQTTPEIDEKLHHVYTFTKLIPELQNTRHLPLDA